MSGYYGFGHAGRSGPSVIPTQDAVELANSPLTWREKVNRLTARLDITRTQAAAQLYAARRGAAYSMSRHNSYY